MTKPPENHTSCLRSISVTQRQGSYMAQMTAQVRSGLLSSNSLVSDLHSPSELNEEVLSSVIWVYWPLVIHWQACTWNNRQEVKGLGLTYTPAYTHAAWWATQLYKVSFTLSASRYAIHMDGHASSLGHTYSASQNSKWPFGMQVHFLWGISLAYHLL